MLLGRLGVAKHIFEFILFPIAEFVVSDCKMWASLPHNLLDEVITLLPLPYTGLELVFVDITFVELGTELGKFIKVA